MKKLNVCGKQIILPLLAMTMALSPLSACGQKDDGPPTVSFTNESTYMFIEINISPSETGDWGPDVLGGTNILKSGGTVQLGPEARASNGIYDIRCLDTDDDYWVFERVPIAKGGALTVILSGDYDPVLRVTDAKGAATEIAGKYDSAYSPGDYDDDSTPENAWIEFTLLNSTSYDMYEAYFMPSGTIDARDSGAAGYNHLESIGSLEPDEDTPIGCEDFGFIDVCFVDEDGDVWAFRDCLLNNGCTLEIESTSEVTVHYPSGGATSFEGELLDD